METTRIHQFRAVVETGNLRKAAVLLGISHSGLFKSLKVLESELGFPLFLPSGRGIVVTDAGQELYERSGRFLEDLGRFLGTAETGGLGRVRLGSFEVFTSFFVGTLVQDDLRDFEVEVHDFIPGRLEDALILDKVDIGITYEPIPRQGIEYVKAAEVQMGIYAKLDVFPDRDALTIPFVVPLDPLEGAPSGVKGLDAWPDNRFERNIRYRVDLMATGLELARQGLCAIFIPDFVGRAHNERVTPELRLRPLPLPKGMGAVRRDVFIVKRESTPESKELRLVARALRKLK